MTWPILRLMELLWGPWDIMDLSLGMTISTYTCPGPIISACGRCVMRYRHLTRLLTFPNWDIRLPSWNSWIWAPLSGSLSESHTCWGNTLIFSHWIHINRKMSLTSRTWRRSWMSLSLPISDVWTGGPWEKSPVPYGIARGQLSRATVSRTSRI